MWAPESTVIDYQIVPAHEVLRYLTEGFVLYGPPLRDVSQETTAFYQALIKTQGGFCNKVSKAFTSAPCLNEIEQRCVQLLAEGKAPDAIAKCIHRSTRRVRSILIELRLRLGCNNNAQMVLLLNRFGLLTQQKTEECH